MARCVELTGEDLSSYLHTTFDPLFHENVRMITSLPTKVYMYFSDITVKNIYQSFTHKMAAKASWH